jgi:ribosomal protein L40E
LFSAPGSRILRRFLAGKLAGIVAIRYLSAMATTCRSCGADLPVGAGRCPACRALVKRPGLFQRLLGGLNISFSVNTRPDTDTDTPSGIHIKTSVRTNIKILDPKTGAVKEYHSLDEVPPDIRAKIEAFRKQGGSL